MKPEQASPLQAFDSLAAPLRRWVWRQGWQSLHPVQAAAVAPVLSAATDVVVAAPTAGGKTEAVWLPVLSSLVDKPVEGGFGAVALAPLKSLINDQGRRLADMARDCPGLEIHPWHGDVAAARKQEARRHPSGVLLTTPESLEAMLALRGPWAREAFRALRYVVVDELHAFVDSERGLQLQSLLARLDMLASRKVARLAMSATLADKAAAARFLRPGGGMPVAFPDAGDARAPVRLAVKEFVADVDSRPEQQIAAELFGRMRGTNNLVFTNSRKEAEAFMVDMSRLSADAGVPDEFRLHHGSLSRLDREAVEHDLQAGNHPVTAICTASMELGVDIGKVASVAQIGVSPGPSVMRQRLGRSGRRGEPAVMRVYSVDERRDDYKWHLRSNLVQNIAVSELLRRNAYDTPLPPRAFTSALVQQLVSLLAQYGSWRPDEARRLLCIEGAPWGFLAEGEFNALVDELARRKVIAVSPASGLVTIGAEGEKLMGGRDFFSAFTTPRDYLIVDRATRRTVGSVQYKPYYGEVFILAGATWIVDSVEERNSTVHVSATSAKGKMMFEGTGRDVSSMVVGEMRRVLEGAEAYPYLDALTSAPDHLAAAREWYAAHALASDPWLRHGDTTAMLTWAGMAANRTIALAASRELRLDLPYDHLAVSRLSPDNAAVLAPVLAAAAAEPALAQAYTAELAAGVSRARKERSKWDRWLPAPLLDAQWGAARLDLPGAAQALAACTAIS